jgi:hypothetical protein
MFNVQNMNRKAWYICVASFVVGLAIGMLGTMIYAGQTWANALYFLKEGEVVDSEMLAFDAYQHEPRPIAIYALQQDLAKLEDTQVDYNSNPALITNSMIRVRLMVANARLGQLLADDGQFEQSSNHVAKALNYASMVGGKFFSITNRDRLFDVLTNWDKKGLP